MINSKNKTLINTNANTNQGYIFESTGKSEDKLIKYRQTLGCYATGVSIITTLNSEKKPIGATVNSFSSVSLNPPLILWSMAYKGKSESEFTISRKCGINILSSLQMDLAIKFARSGFKKFEGINYDIDSNEIPLIKNCAAYILCTIEARHPGGDHVIIIGNVHKHCNSQLNPLIFLNGEFGSLP
tara:strand:+ start:85 stop:639 length:555 start_codon:yes stop_codon:yes gene_type:complete